MRKPVSWKRNNYLEGAKGGISKGPTKGLSSPKNSRRGCLCLNTNTYSRECCEGLLINQGIGNINGDAAAFANRGAFSNGFSNGFDIGNI